MRAEDGDGSTCFTPGCGDRATRTFLMSGGTSFLCAACDDCAEALRSSCPATVRVEEISFDQFQVHRIMEELTGTSYIGFTGRGHVKPAVKGHSGIG